MVILHTLGNTHGVLSNVSFPATTADTSARGVLSNERAKKLTAKWLSPSSPMSNGISCPIVVKFLILALFRLSMTLTVRGGIAGGPLYYRYKRSIIYKINNVIIE
jgi:hypothetical protein